MADLGIMELSSTIQVKTARDLRVELGKNEVPADVIEAVVGAEAPLRHRARVDATITASEEAARALVSDWADPEVKALGAFLRLLDLVGTGGHLGLQGLGTARMSWAQGLGKGRFQASDGSAWKAALERSIAWSDISIDIWDPKNTGPVLLVDARINDLVTRIEIPTDACWVMGDADLVDRLNRFRQLCGIWAWGSPELREKFRWKQFYMDRESFPLIARIPEIRSLVDGEQAE